MGHHKSEPRSSTDQDGGKSAYADSGTLQEMSLSPFVTLEEARANPLIDLRPWASFVLGAEFETLDFWFEWHLANPGLGSRVPLALEFLKQAWEILQVDLPDDVYSNALTIINDIRVYDSSIAKAMRTKASRRSARNNLDRSQIGCLLLDLKLIIAHCRDGSKTYHAWGRLGHEIGLWQADSLTIKESEESLDQIRAIARTASSLPDRDRALIDVAAGLAELGDANHWTDPASFCRVFGQYFPRFQLSELNGQSGEYGLWSAMRWVQNQLVEDLLLYPVELVSQSSPATLHWDARRGVLTYRDQKARTIANQATNVRCILDAFENMSWPPFIENPLKDDDAQRLADTVRSLNKGLGLLRFYARGGSIHWNPSEEGA